MNSEFNFDFNDITVPFRMQPGLRRLGEDARQLTPLDPASALAAEKQAVLRAGESRLAVPGFDEAPVLDAIAARAALERPGQPWDRSQPLELAFEEDFAVLDGATGSLPWLCVCTPSHWSPQDKLGLPFAAVHAPVADAALLRAASQALVGMVTAGERWERHVWTLSPSDRHDQHPQRQPRTPWPLGLPDEAFAARCFLRVERQTFFPVGGGTRLAVFTIRVMLQPLVQAVAQPGRARRLHDALASMSDAVLAYKGLADARGPLLRWLASRSS